MSSLIFLGLDVTSSENISLTSLSEVVFPMPVISKFSILQPFFIHATFFYSFISFIQPFFIHGDLISHGIDFYLFSPCLTHLIVQRLSNFSWKGQIAPSGFADYTISVTTTQSAIVEPQIIWASGGYDYVPLKL